MIDISFAFYLESVIIELTRISSIYTKSPHYGSSEGFLVWLILVVAYLRLSLRVRSQCANKATIQPLVAVAMMCTKISNNIYAPPSLVILTPEKRR